MNIQTLSFIMCLLTFTPLHATPTDDLNQAELDNRGSPTQSYTGSLASDESVVMGAGDADSCRSATPTLLISLNDSSTLIDEPSQEPDAATSTSRTEPIPNLLAEALARQRAMPRAAPDTSLPRWGDLLTVADVLLTPPLWVLCFYGKESLTANYAGYGFAFAQWMVRFVNHAYISRMRQRRFDPGHCDANAVTAFWTCFILLVENINCCRPETAPAAKPWLLGFAISATAINVLSTIIDGRIILEDVRYRRSHPPAHRSSSFPNP